MLLDFDALPTPSGLTTDGEFLGHLVALLPPEFADVTYHYQWSASAGLDGWQTLRCHLWFWLDRPLTDTQLRAWARWWNRSDDFAKDLFIYWDELLGKSPPKATVDILVDKYIRQTRARLFDEVKSHVAYNGDDAEAEWATVETLFTNSDGFATALLKKFIWQVKRELNGIPVEHHLMAIIYGDQGGGKNTFIQKLLSPLGAFAAETDFKEISDNRNVSLWGCYALFIPELSRISSADAGVLRHVITATSLLRRVMGTGRAISVPNCATLIGDSNKRIEQLLFDDTGMRRYGMAD